MLGLLYNVYNGSSSCCRHWGGQVCFQEGVKHLLVDSLVELDLRAIWGLFDMRRDENWTSRSFEIAGFGRWKLVSHRCRDAVISLVLLGC